VAATTPAWQLVRTTTLTTVAGMADAVGYITMGGVFAANMTGNTVLAGIAVAARKHTDASHHFLPLIAFFLGSILSRVLSRLLATPIAALLLETALLVGVGFLPTAPESAVLIVAVAMGLQSSASGPFCGNAVSTVVVTSTLTRTADAIVDRLWPVRKSEPPVIAGLRTLFFAWAGYGLGAIVGALIIPFTPYPLLLPAGLLLLVILVRPRPSKDIDDKSDSPGSPAKT
jgi:uncharacterized membrane protein YoaK (UPF0700 family)